MTIQPREIRAAEGIEKAFAVLDKQRPDGVYTAAGGALARTYHQKVVEYTLKSRLPSMYSEREVVEAGGLMAYGADDADRERQVAWYVDRILKGAKPRDLPVQQPMKFEFVINLQTAKKIGVNINTDVLARATKIIR